MSHAVVLAWLRTRAMTFVRLIALAGVLALPQGALASVIKDISVPCPALGRPLEVSIYQPDGAPPKTGWPVVYLLHGLHGGNRDWASLGGIQQTMDLMIAEHRVRPMMLVMPNGADSWYVNSAALGGPGDYETAILDQLPAAIEQNYPVSRERAGRAIAGISMGGFGALRMAFKRPDRYVAVASLSGALWQNAPDEEQLYAPSEYFEHIDDATVVSGVDRPPEGRHFGRAFGTPFDPKRFNAENVFTLLAQRLHEGAELPAIYLTVGDHDSHKLLRGTIALYETLAADGIDADLRVTGGDHVWSLWRQSIQGALVFIDSRLGAPEIEARTSAGATTANVATVDAIVK